MSMSLILKRLHIKGKKFVTSEELKTYTRKDKIKYEILIRYFETKGYLVRIFRGIFYVKSAEEIELGKINLSHLELVTRGLEIKGVKNWYFGLHTALKLNNLTHESFAIEEVISDSLFRARPIKIANYNFKFVKLSKKLFGFGIENRNGLRISDPEKTVLDFIYLWKQNGLPEEKIISDISEWGKHLSSKKLKLYAENYPSSVRMMSRRIVPK
jgi:predicted transcriptional regulator of viral defense system